MWYEPHFLQCVFSCVLSVAHGGQNGNRRRFKRHNVMKTERMSLRDKLSKFIVREDEMNVTNATCYECQIVRAIPFKTQYSIS